MNITKRLKSHYRTFKPLLAWYLTHRRNGVPVEYMKNKEYLDWHYNYRPSLIRYKNIHKGEDCFIVGNGPSLNRMNLSGLSQYHVFGLNKIHLIFEKQLLKLSYHVAVNPLVVQQMKDELDRDVFACPSFLSYNASRGQSYKNPMVHRLLTSGAWSFYDTILKPICEGFTVTYVAMQLAYYMGFENVFLIGVDHNFKQHGKPNEEQKLKGEDVNHFHPDYFKGQHWHLADLEGNEASYALAKHQFHAANRNIYDATLDGKLQIFDKVSYEQALGMAKKKSVSS